MAQNCSAKIPQFTSQNEIIYFFTEAGTMTWCGRLKNKDFFASFSNLLKSLVQSGG